MTLYPQADIIVDNFIFLADYGLVLSSAETTKYGAYITFKGNDIKIVLGFDYKEYHFYFYIYNGEERPYSDAAVGTDIKTFCDLAQKYDADFDCATLQPSRDEGYERALQCNVMVLKKYGGAVLNGREWI